MPYSYNVYTGNGSTTQFAVGFPYIRREHVFVSVNYVSTAFTWVNNSTVQVSPAPANAARVEVRRVTPVNNPLVDFTDGSTLVAADLDTVTLQQTYINQEQDDQFQDAVFINSQGLLDAGGKRITNVGDPVNAQDVATKAYIGAAAVAKAGDSMTGPLSMGGNKITGLALPTADTDAVNRGYVNSIVANGIGDGDKGDIVVSGSGSVLSIDAGVINDADVNASAGIVASKLSFTQAGSGAAARTVDSKLKDVVSVKDFGAVGDGVVDDTAALNAAAAAAGVAKKALFVPAGVYKTTAPWVIPPRVYVKGESHSVQPGYDPGNTWNYGVIIFKAHTGNAITKTGATAYDSAAPIENITVSSNRTTYPGGNGFVLDSVAGANLFHCRAFGVGGDSFVIGVSAATNTGNNLMEGCYSNNPTGVNYRVRQGYSRINNCLSDGGTYGIYLDNCPLVVVNNFHFEGFTSAGIYLENGCTNLKFTSGLLANTAAALYGVQIASGGGIGHTFNGVSVLGGSNTASSVGISIPSNSNNSRVLNCEISNWATGVDNNASYGDTHTWIIDNAFYQNNLAIRSNGENTIYRGNTLDATIGTWDVSHVAGTKGVWSGNTFGKGALGINPVATGVQGNFSGIRVKENTGYVSRNFGTTGSIAAYADIAHGLAGIPKGQLVLTTYTAGITSLPQIASLDATNFSLYWAGTAPAQWNWEAALPCDY
jgi:hypothetical protein